ncbi:MAG: amidohydrolase family protein [Elusimicrobia bacterium]|jgi:cytosine deaminase|nr:amidohydrolase family protein [Elusimicrobiota bacterium]
MDILIRNAKLREKQYTVDIGIQDGKVKVITPSSSETDSETDIKAKKTIDAGNKLVTPTFIDPHLHMDKALISEEVRENKSGTLSEAIEIIWNKKKDYTTKEVITRASRVIEMGLVNGTTKFRTHVDVDTIVKLKAVEGLAETKKKYAGVADVQIVAFPQEGIYKDPGADKLMKKAMKKGADVVGGMPYNENIPEDSRKHVDYCFDLATKFDADIDMHVDETDDPSARSLEYIAAMAIKENYGPRVTAGHTCALAAYDDNYARKVIGIVKEAGMHMITNPATNLMLQGRLDKQPKRRGITRVNELIEAGINVAYGQDCIKDTFYPTWGREDMLEVGLITAHAAQFTQPGQIENLYDMPTFNSAAIMHLKNYGIKEGDEADMNIVDAETVQEAFRKNATRLYVISKGRVIARTETTKTINTGIK